jgi:hypothetical protein
MCSLRVERCFSKSAAHPVGFRGIKCFRYDDAGWSTCAALLGHETSPQNLPERLETTIDYVSGKSTYYFHHRFQFLGDPARAELRLRTVVDDGAVFYLNGVELTPLSPPSAPVQMRLQGLPAKRKFLAV